MTRASDGSQCRRTGKDRKEATLAGWAIPETCKPRAKRRPEKNLDSVRAAAWESTDRFFSVVLAGEEVSTRLGTIRAARVLRPASSMSDTVVFGDGYTGV